MEKVFNLYCDESCHLKNNGNHVSILGYIGIDSEKTKEHKQAIKDIREKHKIFTEIKWNKVSKSKMNFYKDIIEYFLKSDMIFRGIIIPTGYRGHNHVGEDDFYLMYFKLLSHQLNMNYTYNIYIDIKDTHSHLKVKELRDKLNTNAPIKHNNVQTIRSYESIFIQITDLILGAFSYELNVENKTDAKKTLSDILISYLKKGSDYRKITASDTELFLIDINKY